RAPAIGISPVSCGSATNSRALSEKPGMAAGTAVLLVLTLIRPANRVSPASSATAPMRATAPAGGIDVSTWCRVDDRSGRAAVIECRRPTDRGGGADFRRGHR